MNEIHSLSPLRLKRLLSGFTIDLLSLKTGIDRAKLSRAERGFAKLSTSEIAKISKCLNCSPDEVVHD